MTVERHRILIRWRGIENVVWDEKYPLSQDKVLGLIVCDECGAQVDFLILDSDVSKEEVEQALTKLRDYIADTSHCGKHRLPKTDQPQPRPQTDF